MYKIRVYLYKTVVLINTCFFIKHKIKFKFRIYKNIRITKRITQENVVRFLFKLKNVFPSCSEGFILIDNFKIMFKKDNKKFQITSYQIYDCSSRNKKIRKSS